MTTKKCSCGGKGPGRGPGLTRRGFITSMGVGAMALAVTATEEAEAGDGGVELDIPGGKMAEVVLHVNGRNHRLLVEARWTLAFVLREMLGLRGLKLGCGRGECGACTVLIDDEPRYACMTLAVEAEGMRVETLEGLMQGEELGEVQKAFVEEDAFQCGYCTSGQVMAVEGLLRAVPAPDIETIRRGVSGNLCRCGAYAHIFKAAVNAAERKTSKGGS